MAVCEQCGSIQIVTAQQEPADKLVAFFTAKRPFVCRRCGWRGRRAWTDEDLSSLRDYGFGGAEADPALAILDHGQGFARGRTLQDAEPTGFDLSVLDLAQAETHESTGAVELHERRSRRNRLKRSRRREIVAALAISALAMFLIAMLGLTGSCVGSTGPL
jgi:hypothetical protein